MFDWILVKVMRFDTLELSSTPDKKRPPTVKNWKRFVLDCFYIISTVLSPCFKYSTKLKIKVGSLKSERNKIVLILCHSHNELRLRLRLKLRLRLIWGWSGVKMRLIRSLVKIELKLSWVWHELSLYWIKEEIGLS